MMTASMATLSPFSMLAGIRPVGSGMSMPCVDTYTTVTTASQLGQPFRPGNKYCNVKINPRLFPDRKPASDASIPPM